MKRDDLLGFSFGGNKCRIGMAFLEDMEKQGGNFMVSYGSPGSNLNRTMAALCKSKNIPCLIMVAEEEGEEAWTFNRQKDQCCGCGGTGFGGIERERL